MEKIGTSSLWEYKYRPTTVKDLILPDKEKKYFQDMVESGEIDTMLLYGTAGRGKTSVAIALCKDVGVNFYYVNASKNNSIDIVRNDIEQFATSHSLEGGKKVVILDEAECLSNKEGNGSGGSGAQNALKALIEAVESNCRFIFTTNNIGRINEALQSRCGRTINFNFSQEESKKLMVAYFKRLQWILNNENITFDKKVLAEFIQKKYPDFRKTLNELQMRVKMFGCVDERILAVSDSKTENLIEEMRNKKWNNARKIVSEMDYFTFYTDLYLALESHVKDEYKPSLVLLLAEWSWKAGISNDKEIPAVAAMTEIIKGAMWK
jgi:replication factor C small subunit